MTVSRALNAPGKVTPETLARVRTAVDALGYVPNAMASGLRMARARMVAALLPTLVGPVFQELVESLAESLKRSGYQLMIGQAGYDAAQEEELIKTIIQRRPDGIVLVGRVSSPGARNALLASRIPVVETWDFTDHPVDMLVGFSHGAIGASVAQFLHDRGHRHVAIITANDARAQARTAAFMERSKALGAQSAQCFLTTAPSTVGAGRKGLAALLQTAPEITGVFCSSDSLALGALIEACARGLAVPGQLKVLGYGDQNFARHTDPPLSTMRIDGTQIGKLAARMLVDRIEGRAVAQKSVDVGFELVERDST